MSTINKEENEMLSLLKKMDYQLLTKEEYEKLQRLLLTNIFTYASWIDSASPYPLCKTTITGDKIMFISDTHFGNTEFGNSRFVDGAYNLALQKNIKTVVHAGDLLEACAFYYSKKYKDVFKELQSALNNMPSELTTKLLLWNHDYSAIRTYPEIIPYLFSEPKLDILGMQKVLLNWDGLADIRIHHPITQLKSLEVEDNKEIITLEGHHHIYSFKEQERTIHLPSLSLDALWFREPESYRMIRAPFPLFIIASKQEKENLLFEVYSVDGKESGVLTIPERINVDTKTRKLTLYK